MPLLRLQWQSKDGRKQKDDEGDAYVSLDKQDHAHKGRGHSTTNKNNNYTQLKHLAEVGRELKRHTTTCQLYFGNNFEIYKIKDDQQAKRTISN